MAYCPSGWAVGQNGLGWSGAYCYRDPDAHVVNQTVSDDDDIGATPTPH
jgi:hypothetical protein